MKDFYSIKDLTNLFSVSYRTIERQLSKLVIKEKNKILIPSDIVEVLKVRHNYDTSPTKSDKENIEVEYDVVEGFTNEEYQEFQKRLIEYPVLVKELEYHKKSAESHQKQMEKILQIFEQRNILEATQKLNSSE